MPRSPPGGIQCLYRATFVTTEAKETLRAPLPCSPVRVRWSEFGHGVIAPKRDLNDGQAEAPSQTDYDHGPVSLLSEPLSPSDRRQAVSHGECQRGVGSTCVACRPRCSRSPGEGLPGPWSINEANCIMCNRELAETGKLALQEPRQAVAIDPTDVEALALLRAATATMGDCVHRWSLPWPAPELDGGTLSKGFQFIGVGIWRVTKRRPRRASQSIIMTAMQPMTMRPIPWPS